MKTPILLSSLRLISALALPALAQEMTSGAPQTVAIQQASSEKYSYPTPTSENDLTTPPPPAPPLGNSQGFWGVGVGYVFTKVPISESKFTVVMSELYYSRYLTDPNATVRAAATLGVDGFALILPVPKASLDVYVGDPDQDMQLKLGVGGFYDITVGGAAGMTAEAGVRIHNRIDVSFMTSPVGIDSKRDYLKFIGVRSESTPSSPPYVVYPFYGIFVSFNY